MQEQKTQTQTSTPFAKATKSDAKLRVLISGPSGSGKTYLSLDLATHLVPNGRIAVLDTENGSANLYSDIYQFDVAVLKEFRPNDYVKMLAAAADYDVVIVDSISHEWQAAKALVDNLAAKGGNSFTAWGRVTPEHDRFVQALINHPAHVICTCRTKTEFAIEDNNGRKNVRKLGTALIQRDGLDFEFTLHIGLSAEHVAHIEKTRCAALADGVYTGMAGQRISDTLREWMR